MNNFKRLLKVYFFLFIYWFVPLKNSVLNVYSQKPLKLKKYFLKSLNKISTLFCIFCSSDIAWVNILYEVYHIYIIYIIYEVYLCTESL